MKRAIIPQAAAQAPAAAAHITLNVSGTTDRTEIMGRMELNTLMRGNRCGVLDDAALADWLDGANITRTADDFDGFDVLFGFDRHAQDFVIIKSKTPNGLHFALVA